MTTLLDQAIARTRDLPEDDQDGLAIVLLSILDADGIAAPGLDDETRSAIREGLDQARKGEFASDDEVEALWTRRGL